MTDPTIPNRLHDLRAVAEELRHAGSALEDIGASIEEWDFIDHWKLCAEAGKATERAMALGFKLMELKAELRTREAERA